MSRPRVVGLCVLLLCVALAAAVVYPMPRAVTRQLAAISSTWLVTGPVNEDGRLTAAGKRLVGAYVHMSVAAQIADQVRDAGSEEELLLRIMLRVRNKVLTQTQFAHTPRRWPVLVAGAGYCDQINGAIAMIAARHFEKAQLFGLYDPNTKSSPHSLGRVWSSKRNEWIYFDAVYDAPVIYTRAADGTVRFFDIPPQARRKGRGAPERPIYELDGWVLAEMKSTFAAYVLARSGAGPSSPGDRELIVPELDPELTWKPPVPPPAKVDEKAFQRLSRAFVLARMDDLLGQPPVETYRRIASDPAAARDDRVAVLAGLAGQLASDAVY